MDSTLDVIGSFILFGVLLLAILTMNTNMALSSIESMTASESSSVSPA